MRCVAFKGVGTNDVVSVESRPDPEPGKFEVLIATEYAGVNPADVLQREGRHPAPPGSPPDIPGLEVAGTVIARGDAVTSVDVGDRVFGLVGGGGLADRVVAHERELTRVPEALDDAAAASVPEAFITAFDAISVQAGLGAGDTLLVNGASGGVGTAAVQLGVALDAVVVANVRSVGRRERIAELGATVLGAPEVFEHVRELGGAHTILELVGAGARVFPIELPPLRERKEDIAMLLEYFTKRYATRVGKNIKNVDKRTLDLFQSYHWPGNIRELQNVIERSVILCEGEIFSVDESWLSKEPLPPNPPSHPGGKLIDRQKEMIEAALAESKGRVSGASGAAAKLGIPSSTLESKIKALKIKKHRF